MPDARALDVLPTVGATVARRYDGRIGEVVAVYRADWCEVRWADDNTMGMVHWHKLQRLA